VRISQARTTRSWVGTAGSRNGARWLPGGRCGGALCNGPPPARRLQQWGRWKNSLGTFPKNCSPTILCGEGLPCRIPPSPRRWAMGQHPSVAIRFLRAPNAMAVMVVGKNLDHYRQSTYFRMLQTTVGSLQGSIVRIAGCIGDRFRPRRDGDGGGSALGGNALWPGRWRGCWPGRWREAGQYGG